MQIFLSPKTDNQTIFAVPIIVALEDEFSEVVASKDYGVGAKELSILTDMRDTVLANTAKPKNAKIPKRQEDCGRSLHWAVHH